MWDLDDEDVGVLQYLVERAAHNTQLSGHFLGQIWVRDAHIHPKGA